MSGKNDVLPRQRGLYYGGAWHEPLSGIYGRSHSPYDARDLGPYAEADDADVEQAVAAAEAGFQSWRNLSFIQRGRVLRDMARVLREHAEDLAMIDALDCGNPYGELLKDVTISAEQLEYFAGIASESKGTTLPGTDDSVNLVLRQPLGVVARIVAFNHPFMFVSAKAAAPLAAGNSFIVKPPEQAPLSGLRIAELWHDILPPGVFNVITGGRAVGAGLAAHPRIEAIGLIGSVPTGKAVMRTAADSLKTVVLELGGKNPLIAYPDADVDRVANAIVRGMNFAWCGQSCGSTSRAFIHEDIYDRVLERVLVEVLAFVPGNPTDPRTTMGTLVSREQYDRVMGYIQAGLTEGARLCHGGARSEGAPEEAGFMIPPTIFAEVTPGMRIAREEIFGPVLSVLRWRDEDEMMRQVNDTELGLTCAIWTRDLRTAHRTAARVNAGYVWINEVSRHFTGAPFGGVKNSGVGREECLEELLLFTQQKYVHVNLT